MSGKKTAEKAAPAQAVVAADPGAVPAYLQDQKGSGLKGLDASDFVVPRVKLLQGTSPEVTAHENAKAGEFWLNVLDVPLGKILDFFPISNRKRYLLTPPLVAGNPKTIFARADDAKTWVPPSGSWQVKLKGRKEPVTWEITDADVRKSGLAAFGTSDPDDPDSKPAATLFYDFLIRLKDHPEFGPVLLSLARSQAKKGKDLNGKIELRNKPMQSQGFRAMPFGDTGPEGDFFNLQFAMNGWADEATFNENVALSERFASYRGADEEGEAAEAEVVPAARGDI